jgi:hypothetical protein
MDLHLTAHNLPTAPIGKRGGRALLLILCSTLSFAAVADTARDYMDASEVRGGWILPTARTESTADKIARGGPVSYRAFDGQQYEMLEYGGFHVSALLPAAAGDDTGFTADHLREMVDRLDLLYLLYRELLHGEPDGAGRLTVAFVPESCGMGCGLLGHKGIEILLHPQNVENIIRELDAGRLDSILVHEMVHNFDGFWRHLHYLPDHAHAWTDMFEFFAPYRYARNSRNDESPDDSYRSPISAVWRDYVAAAGADWETCVKNQGCEGDGLEANNLWAMLYYRVESLHGSEALLASFEFLADHARRFAPPRTAEEKEGLRILSLAAGTGRNIACYVDSLRWTLPEETRSELQQRFGDAPAACLDHDGDGFNSINGDCADDDPERHLLAEEIQGNGLDDDCDDLVDEQHLVEADLGPAPDNFDGPVSVSFPFETVGTVSDAQDRDEFRFTPGRSRRARVTLCADHEFGGWAVGLQPDGSFLETANWYAYRPAAGCTSTTFDFGAFGSGGVVVLSDDAPGGYSLRVAEASATVPELSADLQVRPGPAGGVLLQVVDRDSRLAALGAEEVEFWISGVALKIVRPFADGVQVELSPSAYPQLQDGSLYEARMRPRAGGMPLAPFSGGRLFRFERVRAVPAVDTTFSGAWYDPDHEGEGFLVEVLDNDRALVYWFTYTADGRQRWLLGTGSKHDNRIDVAELYDAHGGRFGEDFDPRQVRLTRRGSLEITFRNCSEAVANYLLDGTSGHQLLSRLTQLHGHRCGSGAEAVSTELSGSWYDPSHDGEGFVVEQLDSDSAAVYWFTYDRDGRQAWMVATGPVDGDRIDLSGLVRPLGGVFGRSFDPATVGHEPWGDLLLRLDCDGGTASYAPVAAGFSEGSQLLVPLTRLESSVCELK